MTKQNMYACHVNLKLDDDSLLISGMARMGDEKEERARKAVRTNDFTTNQYPLCRQAYVRYNQNACLSDSFYHLGPRMTYTEENLSRFAENLVKIPMTQTMLTGSTGGFVQHH